MSGGRAFSSLLRCMRPIFVTNRKATGSIYSSSGSSSSQEAITKQVKFICAHDTFVGTGKIEEHLLDVVLKNNIPLEGFGACGVWVLSAQKLVCDLGMLACSTCHVILEKEHYDLKTSWILLDNAPGLTEYSRLGCQIQLAQDDPDTIICIVPASVDQRC
ncbi:hypothetical protein COOONC_17988 [Cooperia oncophora]